MDNFSYSVDKYFFKSLRDLMLIAPDGIWGKIAILSNNPVKG
jgi:hypothetical protein